MKVIKIVGPENAIQLPPFLNREIFHEADSVDRVLHSLLFLNDFQASHDMESKDGMLTVSRRGTVIARFVEVEADFEKQDGDTIFDSYMTWGGRKFFIHTRDSDDDCRRYTVEDELGHAYAVSYLRQESAKRVTLSKLVSTGLQNKVR